MSGGDVLAKRQNYEKEEDDRCKNNKNKKQIIQEVYEKVRVEAPQTIIQIHIKHCTMPE